MHVLMVLFTPSGKGTYWRALQLARHLARRRHSVTLLCTPRGRSWRFRVRADSHQGVTLVESPDLLGGPFKFGWDPLSILTRMRWSPSEPFTVIHGFESRPTVILPALRWRRRCAAPLVLDWCDWFGRGGSVEERRNPILRWVLRPVESYFEEAFRARVDGATVINEVLEHRALALGVSPERMILLPNGCNTDEIRPLPYYEARDIIGLDRDVPVVGYLGDVFWRDAVLLADAFNALVERVPKVRLLAIGDSGLDFRALIAKQSAVIQTGRIPYNRLGTYLAACDVCWLTMRDSDANRGRSPMKLMDYMSAGRPVVTTDVGHPGRVVRERAFGVVVSDTPEDLADKTLELLRDEQSRLAMGRRARHLAETEFSWDHQAALLEAHYERMADLRRG